MSRGSNRVCPRGQQPPVVTSVGSGDVVVYALHTYGGIRDACTIACVRHSALDTSMNLETRTTHVKMPT